MQLTDEQNGLLGLYTQRPDLADQAELEALADRLLAPPARRGRKPAASRSCLTERQLEGRRAQEISLAELGPVRGYLDLRTGLVATHKRVQ